MKITLPLPPKELSPNYRSRSHKPRMRATKAYRIACGWFAKAEAQNWGGGLPMVRATINLHFFFKSHQAMRSDDDNLIASMKPARDSLQDAGIVVNDRDVTVGKVERAIDKGNPRVEIEINEIKGPGGEQGEGQ